MVCSVPLPELSPVHLNQTDAPDVEVTWLPDQEPDTGPIAWIHHWSAPADAPQLSLGQTPEGMLLRFPGQADFLLADTGSRVVVSPHPGTADETLRHLLVDQVLPRLLAHQGRLVLHASAVEVEGRVVAFLGPSGQGKSTLAASFHAAGHPAVGDDALVLLIAHDVVCALATYPGLRLWPGALDGLFDETPETAALAAYSTKRRLAVPVQGDSPPVPLPLTALVMLQPGRDREAVRVTRLSPRDACITLIAHSFQLDVTDPRRATEHLDRTTVVAARVPMFEVLVPRGFARLPEVRTAILRQVRPEPT